MLIICYSVFGVSLVSHQPALTGGGGSESTFCACPVVSHHEVKVHGQGRKVEGAILNHVSGMPKQAGSAGATCITAADFTTLAASLRRFNTPSPTPPILLEALLPR